MTKFAKRYKELNPAQKQAVDTIDGPLLVIAGPGTGKTELLSMRAANILQQTDTLPENILCLTFTDSGAVAMRERLRSIIGPDAHKVAIHTFHSFGTEVINQNNQYFYHGADFQPADELSQYEIMTAIFDELDYDNPLASKLDGNYTHLSDTMRVISELKRAGITSDELLTILGANDAVFDSIERDLAQIFSQKISTTMLAELVPLAQRVASIPQPELPPGITPLANVLALSMAHAFDTAVTSGKTTSITAWRNQWLEKDAEGNFVFKDRKRALKLRAISHVYYTYLTRMEQASLYDYDDMILGVIHAMEMHPDLRYNLQEKYHYFMVDEFQDTNLAQLRMLFDLTTTTSDDAPNVMAVGDDDQAIYSFQGADVNNIHRFAEQYPAFTSVVLTDNYRSVAEVLDAARAVITQGTDRLETTMNLDKRLVAHHHAADASVVVTELDESDQERSWVAADIAKKIEQGAAPSSITVIARRHDELVRLVPYFLDRGIAVSYERRENVLDFPVIQALELLARVVTALGDGRHDEVNALLPELLAQPMFDLDPELIWRLSLASYRDRTGWLETMMTDETLAPLGAWLIDTAGLVSTEPLEHLIDRLIGLPTDTADDTAYHSPLYEYFFGTAAQQQPAAYLVALEALRTIRDQLKHYHPFDVLHLDDFVEFIDMNRSLGAHIVSVRKPEASATAVNLMTAHKAKGLEFDRVYVVNAVDTTWGERVRSRSRLIGYPANLPLAPSGSSYDERLRLFYVAMTRAKDQLVISYARHDDRGKDLLAASFLTGTLFEPVHPAYHLTTAEQVRTSEIAWNQRIAEVPTKTMHELLAPSLADYKLSSTHLNNFLDLSRGGPTHFLLNNLLHFPRAKSANASYGSAIHRTLQKAHNHLTATGERRPIEDVLGDFLIELHTERLTPEDEAVFAKKGADSLSAFLRTMYDDFVPGQKTELSFARQGVVVEEAHLTGSLDVATITDNSLVVTDYKTGKPSTDWKGTTDYEKIKLHKYRQQLMFYELLARHSRDYAKYTFDRGVLQFVEPDRQGRIHALDATFSEQELAEFSQLIGAVWRAITTLDFPDTSEFEPTYKGMLAFEQKLVDNYSK